MDVRTNAVVRVQHRLMRCPIFLRMVLRFTVVKRYRHWKKREHRNVLPLYMQQLIHCRTVFIPKEIKNLNLRSRNSFPKTNKIKNIEQFVCCGFFYAADNYLKRIFMCQKQG